MDVHFSPPRVRAALCVVVLSCLFLACAEEKPKKHVFEEPSSECSNSAMSDEYLVLHGDGHVSRHSHMTKEAALALADKAHILDIEVVEPNYQIQVRLHGREPLPSHDTWGTEITHAESAWDQNIYGQNVVVAVVDTGVDTQHPQLTHHVATNSKEIAGNGIDDDKNGYVDDVHGWDFITQSPNVIDENGHGTHVAGIIAADPDEGEATGMAPKAKIMPLRFLDEDGYGNMADAVAAIEYASKNGAQVINASWGGSACSKIMKQKVESATKAGVLFVAAAGNDSRNLDLSPEFPATMGLENQITVAASTQLDFTADFSSFGFKTVHVAAPGVGIFSTFTGAHDYKVLDGTSMATPFVSGLAALLISASPTATVADIRQSILNGVDQASFPVITRGRINTTKALQSLVKRSRLRRL